MKKILYISANSKCEKDSASKTVARMLINEIMSNDKKGGKCKDEKIQDHLACAKDGMKDFIINALDADSKEDKSYCNEKSCECNDDNNSIVKENIKNGIENVKEKMETSIDHIPHKHQEDFDTHKTMHSNIEKHIHQHVHGKECSDIGKEECIHDDLGKEDTCNIKKEECCDSKEKDVDMKATTECCNSAKVLAHIKAHMNSSNNTCDFEKIHEHIKKHMETYGVACEGAEYVIEEVDVYKDYIPVLTHEYFDCRNTKASDENYEGLNEDGKKAVDRIKELAEQFKSADIYIIAAPMWSLFFPAPLKQYFDCVILDGTTVSISQKEVKGLLDDKVRKMVFVQSVGGHLPIFVKTKLDHSSAYLKDISKFMGISKYEELLVDGTGFTESQKENAIKEAEDEIPDIVKMLKK